MKPSARALCIAAIAFAALVDSTPAKATVVMAVDLETLAQRADLIVRGTTHAPTSTWSEDGRQIHTVTKVTVASTIKGSPPTTVEVHTVGGTVGGVTQKVMGGPELNDGEEVILFLRAGHQHFTISGFSLGKFSVRKNLNGIAKVTRHVSGLGLMGVDGKVRPAPEFAPVSEEEFIQRIKKAISKKVAP